jgi:ribosomal protein L29
MKVTKVKAELKKLSAQDLKEKLDAMRREFFGMKLNSTTAPVKDYSQISKLKKDIARAETYMRQIESKA